MRGVSVCVCRFAAKGAPLYTKAKTFVASVEPPKTMDLEQALELQFHETDEAAVRIFGTIADYYRLNPDGPPEGEPGEPGEPVVRSAPAQPSALERTEKAARAKQAKRDAEVARDSRQQLLGV